LFTDTAIVGNVPHGGKIKPYTLADTMNHGWAWGIPLRDSDHRGYVFSSKFCDEEEALKEMQEAYPGMGEHKTVRFRSGRHQHFWKGNVAAIGNSYAFVEPLESTGIHMIIQEIISLTDYFPVLKTDHSKRILLNKRMNAHWDYLKWFLAIHFKFNNKLDTPFWEACRRETDISGVEEMVELFKEIGPLSYQNAVLQEILLPFKDDIVFGPFGFDLMLLAQGIEPNHRLKVQDNGRAFMHKQKIWNQLLDVALPQEEALRVLDQYPSMLQY
jgi:tryptophan halogenase